MVQEPPESAVIESRSRAAAWPGMLLVAWLIWSSTLFGGFLFGNSDGPWSRIPTPMRMGSSATLVAAAGIAWLAGRRTVEARFLCLVAIGMALGLLGDLFNANLVPIPLPDPVLGGIVAFGLGHVAYILAAVDAERRISDFSTVKRNAALAVWLLIGSVGWAIIAFSGSQNEILRWPALPYSLLLATTTGMFTGLALSDRRYLAMAVGAALFLFSDLVLAIELFRGGFPGVGDLVWLTYGPGQMLIVFGAAFVSGRFRAEVT